MLDWNKVSILIQGSLIAEGKKQSPIIVKSLDEKYNFGSFAILGNNNNNVLLDNFYIQKGQEESLRFATLSPKHRRGEENRIYYSQGHWGIQNTGTGIKFVFHRHGGDLHIGGAWSSSNNVFERLTDYFRSDIIEMFGDDIIILNNLYKLSPSEKKEEIVNSLHDTH